MPEGEFSPGAPGTRNRRGRVLSGMRPTGPLHIGHFFGALRNWIRMQSEYECYFFVADWHALTTDYADTSQITRNTIEIATDWLAAGLDPTKATLFVQSQVPEHAELHLLLSMVAPLGWLERVPTYKEQLENIRDKDLHTYGFLGYPLLQSADIVIYDADFVPVGEDQVPHVEMTREIVRRFNTLFGFEIKESFWADEKAIEAVVGLISNLGARIHEARRDRSIVATVVRNYAAEIGVANFLEKAGKARKYFRPTKVLAEPGAMLTETPRIPGTDGRKMSKSYNNYISLYESDESIRVKARAMMTDPARKRREDPGNPEVCPVFAWHKLFSPPETIAWSDQGCRTAGIGCIECKAAMADNLIRWIGPIRARRENYAKNPERVREILDAGSKQAQKAARRTMKRVRQAIFGKDRVPQASAAGGRVVEKAAGS